MSRVKIKFPNNNPLFQTNIAVRITDINYGNHLGNDAVLSIIHEARVRLFASWGYTELSVEGIGIIMGDVMIAYKNQAFYGDELIIELFVNEITNTSFDILYNIRVNRHDENIDIAHAKTGIICFNYESKKVVNIPDVLKSKLTIVKN